MIKPFGFILYRQNINTKIVLIMHTWLNIVYPDIITCGFLFHIVSLSSWKWFQNMVSVFPACAQLATRMQCYSTERSFASTAWTHGCLLACLNKYANIRNWFLIPICSVVICWLCFVLYVSNVFKQGGCFPLGRVVLLLITLLRIGSLVYEVKLDADIKKLLTWLRGNGL